ncbi:hypothetical protein Hanom_Chr10g00944951 [Helianthus anomalus]
MQQACLSPFRAAGSYQVVRHLDQTISFFFVTKNLMNKPIFYFCREVLLEYSKRTREVTKGFLSGISADLGLDHSYVEKRKKIDLIVLTKKKEEGRPVPI